MPTKADEARARLAEHVDYLRGQIRSMELLRPKSQPRNWSDVESVGNVGLPTQQLEFIAAAIERYLNDEAATLDEAFALAQPAHRPPAYVEMVARAVPLREREKPMPWKHVIAEVGYQGGPREFRRLYDKHYMEAACLHIGVSIIDETGD